MKTFSAIRAGVRAFFKRPDARQAAASECSLELACAVLLLEISLADYETQPEEKAVMRRLLQEAFSLDEQAVEELLKQAGVRREAATSLHDMTRLINEKLTATERVEIIEKLWRVAFADQVMDKYEEYYIRKIAGLLYVSHANYIKARHRAAASQAKP